MTAHNYLVRARTVCALIAAMGLSVGASVAQTINVDMDHGPTYNGTAAAPDSGATWNSISGGGTLGTVVDSQGNTLSGVAITFSSSSGSFHLYNDASSGNPNPVNLMSDYTYGATYTLAITGLIPGQAYGLYAYSHGNVDNQTGTITLAAANGGASASTSQTGDSGNFRNIPSYGLGYNYVVLNGTADGVGTFTFTVVNYLNGLQLQRLSKPVISGLTNQTVVAGTSVVLSADVTGTPPPFFQWWSNSVALAGATNASLVLNNIQYSQNGTAYSLVASNAVGAATNSMTLSVIVTPAITGLNNQAVPTGSTVTMSPTVSGVPAPTLQWRFNGTNLMNGATGNGSTIAGSTSGTLTITSAQVADGGIYSLVASNSAGMATNSMTLTVSSGNVAPNITGPNDQTVVQTSNATFSASVSGLPLPTLQWRVNGTDIPGATNPDLVITNVQYSRNGDVYSLVASNSAGKATNSAILHVLVPPAISQQPTNLAVTVGDPATFSVGAGGVPAPNYQWFKNGSPISGATASSYTIASAQGADNEAVFSVGVSNSVGVTTSSNAALTVLSTMTGSFLPANGATGIAPDQQLRIVFSSPPHLGAGKLYVHKAADNSVFATIDVSQFQTFSLFAATITNAAVRTVQGSSYYYMPIAIYGNEAWITLNPTNRLVYNQTYYVTADPGLFLDDSGAAFPAIAGSNTWRFSTKAAGPATPTASTGPTNIAVGLDGTGDFATLQGASDWIPQDNTLERTITVLPGTYRDFAVFAQNRNNVRIIGVGARRQDVQIIYPYAAYSSANDRGAGTLRLESSDIYVRNLTIDNQVYLTNNGVVFAGPINVLATTGNRLVFDNVLIKGGQDTIYNVSGSIYYNHCEVWGSVDYIYGSALSVFDQCNIVEIRSSGGPVTAPSTDYAAPYGIVFLNCTFPQALVADGYPYDVNVGSTTMMRPWRQDGATALINCAMDSQVSTKGWGEWDGRETTCRAREYGTTLIGGGSVTPAQRQAAGAYWLNTIDPDYTDPSMNPTNALLYGSGGTNNRVAVTVNPSDYTLPSIFGNPYYNLSGWLPTVVPTIAAQPASQAVASGNTATFTVMATGLPDPTYQWLKDGTNLAGQTSSTLTVSNVQTSNVGAYSVIVSNSAGLVTSSNAMLTIAYATPPQPVIPNGTNNVTNFGAVGDGVTTNTAAIQAAINALAVGPAHGGTVEIPPGVYLSGPLHLSNSINLQIDAGATLEMLPYGSYPSTADFISGANLHDIEVSGSGTIDGQGADWWTAYNSSQISRPKAMFAVTACSNVLVRDVTLQNPPNTHISFRFLCRNVTVNHINIETPLSPNTDGIDCSGANVLIENSHISDGDDHVALGDGHVGYFNHDITVANCLLGNGHGISIGSYTTAGLSNLLVMDCVWTNGSTGIRIKADIDRGGPVQDLKYYNLTMTNVQTPIYFYSYYTNSGTSSGVTFDQAASYPVFPVSSTTPIWRDIVISNLTAFAASGRSAGILWGRPEMCISNVVLDHVNITASKYFEIYNARGIQLIDSKVTTTATANNFGLFNAEVTISNRAPSAGLAFFDGITTNGYGNTLSLYNADGELQNTNALGDGPLALGGSAFTVDNNLVLSPAMNLHLALGTNTTGIAINGNLSLGGTLNVSNGGGLTNGAYTVMTYGGSLSGASPTLGNVPAGFKFSIDTNTVGQVKLVVAPPVNTAPTNLTFSAAGNVLEVNWPLDHTGWWLQMQTNDLSHGLGTNWITVPNSDMTNHMLIPINATKGCTFLRLFYPTP